MFIQLIWFSFFYLAMNEDYLHNTDPVVSICFLFYVVVSWLLDNHQ